MSALNSTQLYPILLHSIPFSLFHCLPTYHSSAERLQKIRSGVLATAEVDCIKGGHRRVPPTTGATGKEGLRAKAVQRVARVLGDVVRNFSNFIHVVRYALQKERTKNNEKPNTKLQLLTPAALPWAPSPWAACSSRPAC